MKRTVTIALLVLSGMAQASVITTQYNRTNAAKGNMFDVVTLDNALTVTGFDLNFTGTATVSVYRKAGTWVGSENDPSAWTLIGSGVVNGAGLNTPTSFDSTDFTLDANTTTALYFSANSGTFNYTAGTQVGAVGAANADLKILQGAGVVSAFSGIATPRIWNGSIYYNVQTNHVPEPTSVALLAAGLLAIGAARRRA